MPEISENCLYGNDSCIFEPLPPAPPYESSKASNEFPKIGKVKVLSVKNSITILFRMLFRAQPTPRLRKKISCKEFLQLFHKVSYAMAPTSVSSISVWEILAIVA